MLKTIDQWKNPWTSQQAGVRIWRFLEQPLNRRQKNFPLQRITPSPCIIPIYHLYLVLYHKIIRQQLSQTSSMSFPNYSKNNGPWAFLLVSYHQNTAGDQGVGTGRVAWCIYFHHIC